MWLVYVPDVRVGGNVVSVVREAEDAGESDDPDHRVGAGILEPDLLGRLAAHAIVGWEGSEAALGRLSELSLGHGRHAEDE